jgi:KDO2-lipid IV(A) lauroyltransferase
VAEPLGEGLGGVAYRLGWRRQVVEDHLAQAFPERSQEWVTDTAKSAFRHVGREWLSVPYVSRRGLEEVRRRVIEFEGHDALQTAFEERRGVVLVSGHFGNWDLAGSTLAAFGYPVDAVMQGMRNDRITPLVQKYRRGLGMGLIDRAKPWGRFNESLSAGRLLAFVADQDAGADGVFLPWFGKLASTHRAPALLALRAGAPIMVGGAYRIGPRAYHLWLVRLDHPEGGDIKERVHELTRRWVEELERRVRLYPDQYFWHHKRWKTLPPGTDRAPAGSSIGASDTRHRA